ncbi:hypothetical protein MnTg02_02987 [bacterium MnTg02]|nr:hypothetical protein MnTg02_02987 [bacterium MnTg02]
MQKLTLGRIALHEFNRALRIWKRLLPPEQIIELLITQRDKMIVAAIRTLGIAIIGVLWLASNKSALNLSIKFIELSVPAAFVNTVVALALSFTLLNLINYFLLNEFIRLASNKLFKFESAWALTVPYEGGNAYSLSLVQQFRFFQSSKVHKVFGKTIVYLWTLPFLLIFMAIYWTVFAVGYNVLHQDGILSVTGIFTIASLLSTIIPIMLIIFINIPFKFSKNAGYIRWLFLYPIYRRQGLPPPDRWISG